MAAARQGWFTFEVVQGVGKNTIAVEVARRYNVQVRQVRTVRLHGKVHRVGRRQATVRRPDRKKAMVRLASGQRIPAFEVAEERQEGR